MMPVDLRWPERHWLVLATSLLFFGIALWLLLGPDEQVIDVPDTSSLTKLKRAPSGTAIVLLEQPLFNKERSPPELAEDGVSLTAGAPAEAIPIPPAPPSQLPTLVGIAAGRGKAVAIMKGLDGSARNYGVGDDIDGWAVVSISRNAVRVTAVGVTQNISLNYQNQNQASSTPVVVANAEPERGN